MTTIPPDATHWAVMAADADITIYLPVTVNNKHYTEEEHRFILEGLAPRLGCIFLYLMEIHG